MISRSRLLALERTVDDPWTSPVADRVAAVWGVRWRKHPFGGGVDSRKPPQPRE